MEHSFDIQIAQNYGVNAAIILNNLYFWIEKNRANDDNFFDGHYWTYNSISAFEVLFPYLSAKQIRGTLQKLENEGIIKSGNYNKSAYDRTKWYAITNKGFSILQKGKMEETCRSNQNDREGEPIPDITQIENTDTLFAQFWEAYPKKRSKDDAFKAFKSRKPNPILVGEMIASIQLMKDSGEWANDRQKYIPYPASWLRAGGWKDEIAPPKPQGKVWKSLD